MEFLFKKLGRFLLLTGCVVTVSTVLAARSASVSIRSLEQPYRSSEQMGEGYSGMGVKA